MTGRERYPAHWWGPISEEGKPDWEILPQAAGPGEVIISKRNELGILSNFWPCPFELDGERFASMEGWWQMQFYPEVPPWDRLDGVEDPRATHPGIEWKHTRPQVAQMSSHEAWFAGVHGFENMRAMGIDWVSFHGRRTPYWNVGKEEHYALVVRAMKAKLAQNPRVREVLLSTGDLRLRADHFEPPDAPPSWAYYRIWMEIRDELL